MNRLKLWLHRSQVCVVWPCFENAFCAIQQLYILFVLKPLYNSINSHQVWYLSMVYQIYFAYALQVAGNLPAGPGNVNFSSNQQISLSALHKNCFIIHIVVTFSQAELHFNSSCDCSVWAALLSTKAHAQNLSSSAAARKITLISFFLYCLLRVYFFYNC